MENYDIAMIVVLVGATLFGAFKGFAWQLASITSIVLSYFVAYRFREALGQSIQADPPWNRFLAMLILYVGTSLVIWVAFRMVAKTIDRFKLKEFDRQIGALFGLAKGAFYCILITMFAVTLLGDNIRTQVVQSKSGLYIAQVLDRSEAIIPPEIQEIVGPYLKKFDERLQEGQNQESGSGGGLAPWLNQVTENATVDRTINSTIDRALKSTPIAPWTNGSGSSNSLPPQQAERPWSSVYSSGGTR